MRRAFHIAVIAIACLLTASPLGAQTPDMTVMAKWASVTIVRYVMTGVYRGDQVVMRSPRGIDATAQVVDSVELVFTWNQQQMVLVGAATVRNFPAGASLGPTAQCPAPRITTPYDGWVITSATTTGGGGALTLSGKRMLAAGSFPRAKPNVPASQEVCGDVWEPVAASSEPVEMIVGVATPLWYAMPSAGGENVSVTRDGKSIIVVDPATGWTWRYTATAVQ